MSGKIAFIGTHGVGKTVLTFSLAGRLRAMGVDADVAHENSRRSPFPINEATTFEGQLWILAAQLQAELEAQRRSALVVCDRAVLDNYAYMVRACGRQEQLHPLITSWCRTYDVLFRVPIVEAGVARDRARATSRRFQHEIHDRIGELLEEFDVSDRLVELPRERSRHADLVLEELRARRLLPPKQCELFEG